MHAFGTDVDADSAFLFGTLPRSRLPPEAMAFMTRPIEVDQRTIEVLACHRIRLRKPGWQPA